MGCAMGQGAMGARGGEGTPIPDLQSLDVQGVASHIERHAKRIVVMAGAGISTSAGIPDFRSPGSGLYDNLQKYDLPCPEAMFEIGYFTKNPTPFYDLVRELWPGRYRPTASHWFLRLLYDKGLLQRVYTQNIDSLETAAGLPKDIVVAAHGNFDTCHALRRPGTVPPEELRAALQEGGEGWESLAARHGGLVKPSIVFFGESLPSRFFELPGEDFPECDLLIVMGTSLAVQPFASLVGMPPPSCPRVLVNRDMAGLAARDPWSAVLGLEEEEGENHQEVSASRLQGGFRFQDGENRRDVFLQGDCDTTVLELCRLLGWEEELARLMEQEA